jgi:hypothetical protein
MVRIHLLCTFGLQRILAFGKKRYGSIRNALKFTSVMPAHKSITSVDGMQGRANHDISLDVTYLPISLGYWSCYKRYMALLGYIVWTISTGDFIVTGGGRSGSRCW